MDNEEQKMRKELLELLNASICRHKDFIELDIKNRNEIDSMEIEHVIRLICAYKIK